MVRGEHMLSSNRQVYISIEGHGDWHPQPHPDLLHAEVLVHPVPPVPSQQGEGYFARTLYAALKTWPSYIHLASSHYCVITVINLFFLSSYFPLISLVSYWVVLYRLCPIVMLILSPPPPFLLFYLGCVMYLVKLMHFLSCCTHIPHMTTSPSDCPIVFILACLYLLWEIC